MFLLLLLRAATTAAGFFPEKSLFLPRLSLFPFFLAARETKMLSRDLLECTNIWARTLPSVLHSEKASLIATRAWALPPGIACLGFGQIPLAAAAAFRRQRWDGAEREARKTLSVLCEYPT